MNQATTPAGREDTLRVASGRRERPVIRLFGPLAIEDGERRLGPGDLGGSRPKQVLEILIAARGHRVPQGPGHCCAEGPGGRLVCSVPRGTDTES